MGADQCDSLGSAVAGMLTGAWRESPPELAMSPEERNAVLPLLLGSGAGALAWWRIRQRNEPMCVAGIEQLRQAYWHSSIHAAKQEREVVEVFKVLRSAGIEPILIKGWAIARAYPETGLRPAGDIDLCFPPAQYAKARSVLNTPEYQQYWIDLEHDEVDKLDERSFQELYRCSELVKLENTEVRVLGAEDHLRILCFHLLKHGAWRPLWLCDVSAALESRPPRFDWDRCLGRNNRRANWVLCALGLAHQLLGARLGDAPVKSGASSLPGWLIPSVLKQWNAPYPPNLPLIGVQIRKHVREPIKLLKEIRKRWPNPIQATVDANREFDGVPRLPFQIGYCIVRAARLLPELVRFSQRHD
jgi:Uncharacterised nucleotidyltransferase